MLRRPMESAARDVDAPRARRRWLELGGWILLWLVARGALVLALADVFFYGEELEKACAGKALLDGLGLAHHQLAYHYYEGGGFVVSHLDALAFALFGETLLAVKLVALALGACVLAAGWTLTERFGGRTASRVFALLFVFAPLSVQKNSLLALGIHFHAMLFVALVLLFAGRVLFDRDRRLRTWFLLGLSAGFGLYFSYQLALTLAIVAVALAWKLRGEVWSRASLAGVVGFLLGVAPLAWMASHVGAQVFDIHGQGFTFVVGEKLATLRQFASSFDAWEIGFTTLLIALIAGGAWAALRHAPDARTRGMATLVVVHLALFVAAYLGGAFTVGRVLHYFQLHRLMPAWFLAVLLIALGAAVAWQRWPRIVRDAVGAFALIGVLSGAPWRALRTSGGWELVTRTKGYAYAEYIGKVRHHVAGTSADKLDVFLRFDEPHPELLYAALAENLYADASLTVDEMRAEVKSVAIADERGFLLGLGYGLRERHMREGGAKDDVAGRVRWLDAQPSDVRAALVEAVGRFGLGLLNTRDRLQSELSMGRGAGLPDEYFIGLGYRAWGTRGDLTRRYVDQVSSPLGIDVREFEAFVAPLDARERALLGRGYERAVRDRSFE